MRQGCFAPVRVQTGVDEVTQRTSFQNATLQGAGKKIAFSVATYVSIPETISAEGEVAVASFVSEILALARFAAKEKGVEVRFDIEVGPAEGALEERPPEAGSHTSTHESRHERAAIPRRRPG